MWELDCEESWVPKNWCFWTVVLEKTLESPLDCKEIQPVHTKGDQPWVFIGRTDTKEETPILWPPHVKSWLIWKDPDAGKDWGQKEKGTSWQIDGETVETVTDFFLRGASKITADGDWSHEIKRCLLLGRKVMTNLDRILKSRDITLPTKVHLVKLWVFQWSCMDVRVGLWRKLSAKEWMLLNCGVGEVSWESLGLQGDPTCPS